MQVIGELFRRDDYTPRRIPVYFANLFFSLHYAAILYVNSSLLSDHFSSSIIAALFVAGSLGNILLFLRAPKIISVIGNRALFVIALILEGVATIGLALANSPLAVGFYFFIFEAVSMMVYYALDIFLEAASENKVTGDIRGMDLTIANFAILFGPLLVAIYAVDHHYMYLYLASSLLLIPVIFLGIFSFKTFHEGKTLPITHNLPFSAWNETRNIKGISLARLALEFFYAIMAIYVPIYLHTHIGFSWQEIGVMFTIMLLPFVFLQLPAGELSDTRYGEKEILTLGFFVMGLSLLSMPYLDSSFVLWTSMLFLSRIGASLIEVMTDSYFFKHVDRKDTGLISIFRLMRPLAIILAAAVAGVAIALSSYLSIFFILMISTFWGMYQGLRIVDTR